MEGQMQEIFTESLDNTREENLWQENGCIYNKYWNCMNENWSIFFQLDLNISVLCGGEEIGLQIYVLLSSKCVHCPKAWQIGCESNR